MVSTEGGRNPEGKQLEREKYKKISLKLSKDKGLNFLYFNSRPKSVLIAIITALTALATVSYLVQYLVIKITNYFY